MPLHLHQPGWVGEFRAFIMRGNVVDLAVGLIIGAAFTAIVASLVEDLFTPLLGLLLGGFDFTNIFVTLRGEHAPTLEAARRAGAVTLNIGLFLNAVLKFLVVAFAIFWVVKALSRFKAREEAKSDAVPTPTEALLMEIRDELRAGRTAPGPATPALPG